MFCVGVLVLSIAVPLLSSPASAQGIPIIHVGRYYTFYDSTGGYADSSGLPLYGAAFDTSKNLARTLVNYPGITFPVDMRAWVGKTVQIADAGNYEFWWFGHYNAVVSACLAEADVWFYVRVLDVSTMEVMGDAIVGQTQTTICLANGINSDFYYWMDISIPSSRVNHQFSIQVMSRSYGAGIGGTAIADAWNTAYTRGVSYSKLQIIPPPSGPGGGCVARDTPILTPEGYVPVQHLERGDTIFGYDFGSQGLVPVHIRSIDHAWEDRLISVNNGTLFLTLQDQPLYIRNETYTGWLRNPSELRVHDTLFNAVSHTWVEVITITTVSGGFKVYDVATDGPNNFIANGFLLDRK